MSYIFGSKGYYFKQLWHLSITKIHTLQVQNNKHSEVQRYFIKTEKLRVQQTFTCSKSTTETCGIKKCKKCSKFKINTTERHWRRVSRVSMVDFEQVNVSWVSLLSLFLKLSPSQRNFLFIDFNLPLSAGKSRAHSN